MSFCTSTRTTQAIQTIALSGNPSSSPVLLNASQIALLQDARGDVDFAIRMVVNFDQVLSGGFTFLHATHQDGSETKVLFDPGALSGGNIDTRNGVYSVKSRGTVILDNTTTPPVNVGNILSFANGCEIVVHFHDKPWLESKSKLGDTAGFRVDVNGCYIDGTYANGGQIYNYSYKPSSGGTISPITAIALGSNLDGTGAMNATVNQFQSFYSESTDYQPKPDALVVGDSLLTSWTECAPPLALARSVPGYRTGPLICMLAHPGAFCADQLSAFQSWLWQRSPRIKWVYDRTGANNVIFPRGTAATMGDAQSLINTIRTALGANAGFKYVRGILLPGSFNTSDPTSKQMWIDLNGTAAAGYTDGQLNTLTGVDAFVRSYVTGLGDGTSPAALQTTPVDYRAIAQAPNVRDSVHHTDAARLIDGQAAIAGLTAAGVWTT